MSLFTIVKKRYAQITAKQFIFAGVFLLALAGTIGAGFAARSSTAAAVLRDCDDNAIMRCGSADKAEFIDKTVANTSGRNGDLPKIYGHFGLPASQYDEFEDEAKYGTFYRDGRIEVESKTVADNGRSMGRQNFGGSQTYTISGAGTYYYGTPDQRWHDSVNSLPVMVWFDDEGVVKMVVMSPCGNPVPKFDKKKPTYSCDELKKHIVNGKKNTYQFSADASNNNLANVVKFTYSYNDGSGWKVFDTTTSETAKTKEITFEKSSKVKVEIEFVLINGKKKTGITSVLCEKEIGVVKEEFLYTCEALLKIDVDTKTFRFAAVPHYSNNVKPLSADFTLDASVTTKGVTDKDKDGNFVREYVFNDNKSHTVSAIINFEADGKKVQSKEACVKTVTVKETPVCPEKPNLPPDHPDCKVELTKAGPGGLAGLFVGISAVGAAAHRLYISRKNRG